MKPMAPIHAMTPKAIHTYTWSSRAHRSVGIRLAARMIRPPMVGVPAFFR
jgi:hypothetical protein